MLAEPSAAHCGTKEHHRDQQHIGGEARGYEIVGVHAARDGL